MVNYKNSKIYKLICNDENLVYIGSTTSHFLSSRLARHRIMLKQNKKCTSFLLFEKGDVKIILLESFECNSKDELRKKEQEYIDKTICVNKHRAYVSKEQKYLENKKYRLENKDKINEKRRLNRKKFKEEHLVEYLKKTKIETLKYKDKRRELYLLNRETQLKKQKENYYLKKTIN